MGAYKALSCSRKRATLGGEKFLVVKRLGEESCRPCGQRRGTNQRVVLSGENNDAG
jgi:hypothetical protein